ncbi:MAG: hypothetical protein HUJ59_03105 [Bacilli bacterium]|nr:hypothetical protein [Bacilli bacterium]
MTNKKKIISSLAMTVIAGAAMFTSIGTPHNVVKAEGETPAPTHYTFNDTEAEYIDFITGFTSNSTATKNLARFRNSTFWAEGYRYNGLDYFCDTILTDGDESGNVTLVSRDFDQKGQPYVCFTMGGGNNNNIYMSLQYKDGEDWNEITRVKNNYFADPLVSMQMVYRLVEVPEAYRNSTLRAVFVDNAGTDGGFRLLTFGAFTGACSLNSAAKLYNMYKEALISPEDKIAVTNSTNAIKTILNTSDEYAPIRATAAALGEVYDISESFETFEGFPTFTEDYLFNITDGEGEEADRRFNSFTNDLRNNASTYWVENIPFNKTGNYFFDSEKLPGEETSRARYFSTVFTLSGSGVISFKMAGESARFSLWDAEDYTVLMEINGHDGYFVDGGVRPIDTVNGRRTGTMQRIVVDASKFLGKKVFIDIEDDRTGGGWGLARFDEIVTYYATVPSFKIDSFNHNYDSDNFYAINYDKFVTTEEGGNADLAAAYNFLQNYYATMRNPGEGYSRCGINTESLMTTYNALSETAQDIVDNSYDFCYENRLPGANSTAPAHASNVCMYTVGEAISEIISGVPSSSINFFPGTQIANTSVSFVLLLVTSVALLPLTLILKKKKAK